MFLSVLLLIYYNEVWKEWKLHYVCCQWSLWSYRVDINEGIFVRNHTITLFSLASPFHDGGRYHIETSHERIKAILIVLK